MTEAGMPSTSSVADAWGAGDARAVAEKRRKASDLYCILKYRSMEVWKRFRLEEGELG
jgi:hypothetical protein